jgi:COP9 signalosome complex subunit 6
MALSNLVVETPSDTGPHVILHPLVLVSVSDHGTRATLKNNLPIFGAILGQNNGKEITLEIAFECGRMAFGFEHGAPVLNQEWFSNIVQDRKEASL